MANNAAKLEQQFFRQLNTVAEPLISSGLGSPSWTPTSLIVLESIGYRSGLPRRTPLWSVRMGSFRLISTARGARSFWVKNLQKQPEIQFTVGGKTTKAEAILIAPGFDNLEDWELARPLARLMSVLSNYVDKGWAFGLLVPEER